MDDCVEHQLVFQKVVDDCWFVHLCKLCDKVVLSNRVEGVIEEDKEGEEFECETTW